MQLPETRTVCELMGVAENPFPVFEHPKKEPLQKVEPKERHAVVVLHRP